MHTTIKHSEDIEADIDADQGVVTLRVRNFDSQAVADFVTEVLPKHGVFAHRDDQVALPLTRSFQLALFMGGRRHTAHVRRLADGRTTVRLDCPFEDHKRNLRATGVRALQLFHEAGWQAIVIGDVPNDTITWDSKVEVRIDDRERRMSNDEWRDLQERLEAEASYDAFVDTASGHVADAFEGWLRQRHWSWNSESGSVAEYAVHRPSRDLQGKLHSDSDAPVADAGALRWGEVSRLNQNVGFGYVHDDDGVHSYIFVFGHAIKHSDARQLSVGARVRFQVEERGRVSKLQLA